MSLYDLIVVGGGAAGAAAATYAGSQGNRVVLVDSGPEGGRGLVLGPDPLRGFVLSHNPEAELPAWEMIKETGKEWVLQNFENRQQHLKKIGVEFISGKGRVLSPARVQIELEGEPRTIEGKAVLVATGSKTRAMASIPFDGELIIDSEGIWNLPSLPESLLIVGSDLQSLEWAFVLRRLGVKVFLVHEETELLPGWDQELLDNCEKTLKQEKVKILLNKKVTSIFKSNGGLDITLDGGVRFSVEKLVVCAEREVDLSDTILPQALPDCGSQGELLADDKRKTTVPGIFAAGSVTGHRRGLYLAQEEGRVAAANALGKKKSLHQQLVPQIMRLSHTIGNVGCNKDQAHHLGYRGMEGRSVGWDCDEIGDSAVTRCKLVFEKESREIIGGQAYGPAAGELIEMVQVAMRKGMTVRDFCQLPAPAGSFWEVLGEAAADGLHKLSELR